MDNIIRIFTIILFSIMVSACSQKPVQIVSKPYLNQNNRTTKNPYIIYVRQGDNLYNISKKHNVPIRDLIEINRIRPPYILYNNQILRLPKARFHIVKKGDNVFAVSRSFDVDLSRLVHFNNLQKPYVITPGMKLHIPSSTEYTKTEHATYKVAKVRQEVPQLSKVVSKDLTLLKQEKQTSQFILPNKIKKPHNYDSNAPTPILRLSTYPSPNLKPGTTYSKKLTKSSYNYNSPIKRASGFQWPVNGRVISQFGPKKGGLYNDGINISSNEGAPIKASDNGKVVYSGNELRGYGNLVLIKHSNGYITAYAHSKKNIVKKGDRVKKGDTIGYVGKTGHVSKPQLHFSIRKGRKALNPRHYLPG